MDNRSTSLRVINKKSDNRLVRDISESLGKLPPAAVDLEQAVLGALMLETRSLNDVVGFLRPEHFYTEQHKEIYTAIQSLYAAGDPIDMRIVVQELRRMGKIELVGGAFYIAELTSKVSSSANIEHHVRILQEQYLKREFIQLASSLHHKAYDDTVDVFEMIDWATQGIQNTMDKNLGGQQDKHVKEIAVKAVLDLQARMGGTFTGIHSGFESLDRILNGHKPGDLVILAARPGMGKTSFMFQEATQMAERGLPVGFFSLEMPSIQLVGRAACSEAEVDNDKFQKGILDEYEFKAVMEAFGKISNLPLFIDDTAMLNILDLRARAHRWKMKHGIKAIFVDFIQLVKVLNEGGMNRDQEIGVVTRTLKAIAKELELPVIAISSLSRAAETRGGDKRPQLSDLRESGNIESDADVVIFIYRPEYYKITQDEHGFSTHGLAELIVAKHRNGSLDTAKIKFVGKHTKFKPWYDENIKVDYVARQKSTLPPERDPNSDTPF